MLLGVSWWAGLYILLLLLLVYMELKGVTFEDDEDDDGSSSVFEYITIISRLVYYTSLLLLSILFFQNIDSGFLKWLYLGLAIYSLPFGLWFAFDEIKNFIKDPAGKKNEEGETVEDGEETGIFFNAIGYSIPLTLYCGGLAFAIIGSLPLI